MRTVFVDTGYWIAIFSPRDQWHGAASATRDEIGRVRMVTTDEVLA